MISRVNDVFGKRSNIDYRHMYGESVIMHAMKTWDFYYATLIVL